MEPDLLKILRCDFLLLAGLSTFSENYYYSVFLITLFFVYNINSSFYKFKSSVIQTMDQDCPGEAVALERIIDGYARAGLDLLCGDFT